MPRVTSGRGPQPLAPQPVTRAECVAFVQAFCDSIRPDVLITDRMGRATATVGRCRCGQPWRVVSPTLVNDLIGLLIDHDPRAYDKGNHLAALLRSMERKS